MKINEIIRKRRKELGLTLKQVAEELGVSESLISRYESSEVKNMGIDKIKPLAKILKCEPEYLMGWTEDNKKQETQDDIITTYNLTPDELLEYEKIKSINRALFFNDNRGSDEDKEELDEVLKKIFVKSLLNKRNKEK